MAKSTFITIFISSSNLCSKSTSLCYLRYICKRNRSLSCKVIGDIEEENSESQPYQPGQTVLHKAFNYRGLIISFDRARLHLYVPTEEDKDNDHLDKKSQKVEIRRHLYYQILRDERDVKTSNGESIPQTKVLEHYRDDVQLVPHEDIIPYKSSEDPVFDHHLFKTGNRAALKESIRQMEITNVYQQMTNEVRVTVMPFYIKEAKVEEVERYTNRRRTHHCWMYNIRIDNLSDMQIQIRYRKWNTLSIESLSEIQYHPKKKGVVGKEPIIKPKCSFQYKSQVPLQSPRGKMWGFLGIEKEDGTMFDCHIPKFILEAKQDEDFSPPEGWV